MKAMKLKVIILTLMSSILAGGVFAQVEHDDMYFNSKDRKKLREAQKAEQVTLASIRKESRPEEDSYNNPTDSYSARNVNPEFTSRSQSEIAREDEADYFVNNYQYNRSNYNNFNNNFNNWYDRSWYRSNYWAPSIYGWNSRYYGYYDSWNSPWNDPYWANNGWSSSFSFYTGNSWNYGWGGSYNYWNRPYCGVNSYYGYGSNYGYGGNWYWNNYRYPQTVVVVNNGENGGRGVAYGKRATRGSSMVSDNNNNRSRTGTSVSPGRGDSGGRVSTGARTEYYNRSWRNTGTTNTQENRSNTQNNRSWSNTSNSGNNSSWNDRSTNSTYSPAPSRSNNSSFGNNSSSGGNTRSHSSSGSSGSNGRTRGRD
jgi:hypothetical protein